MIDPDLILTLSYICLPTLLAMICLYYAFSFLKAARNIEDTPTSRIRSAAQGYVELNGVTRALLKQPLLGKLTQTPCAWYRYTIEEHRLTIRNGSTTSTWNLIDQGMSQQPFILEDETGECVILPSGAEIIETKSISWRDHTPTPGPPPTSFFIWLIWNSWGPYRFTEYRLELDSPVYASGLFCTKGKNDSLIEGIPALQDYLTEKSLSTVNILHKQNLSQNQNFIISSLSEKKLIMQFKLKAFLFFISFLVFIVIMTQSTYPMVKQALLQWQSKQ